MKAKATLIARQRAAEAGEPIDLAPDLSDVRVNDLRRSYASFAVDDGAPLFMFGKPLVHK